MIEQASIAFATLFATIGPIDLGAVYAGLTGSMSVKQKKAIAIKGTLIGALILLIFALAGKGLLHFFGISLPALRTSGGILLLLIGIDMVFARDSGATSMTDDEDREAHEKTDIAVFPIATPLIAGPGAMGAVMLLMAQADGNMTHQLIVILALFLNLALALACLLLAGKLQRLLGVMGVQVITRVMGVLLSALAVQFIFDGILQSGLILR